MTSSATELDAGSGIEPLTERELAIINGEDPDMVGQGDVDPGEAALEGEGEEVGAGQEADVAGDPEGGTDAADASQWITPEVEELAASYGFSRDRLQTVFKTREDFERQAAFYDRDLAERQAQQPAVPAQQPAGGQAAAAVEQPAAIELDPAVYEAEGYDEKTVQIVKFAAGLKAQLDRIAPAVQHYVISTKQQIEAANRRAETEFRDAFHDALDGAEESLFGRSVDAKSKQPAQLSPEHDANRRKVWEAIHQIGSAIQRDAAARGVQAELPSPSVLRQRAINMVFGDQLRELQLKRYKESVARQARTRRPAAGRPRLSASGGSQQPVDEVKRIANDPEVVAAWSAYQEA